MKYRKLSDIQKAIEADEYEWELSPDHELTYKERATGHGPRATVKEKEACFTAPIVAAEPDALVVAVAVEEACDPNPQRIGTDSARTRRSRPIRTVTGLIRLSGKWELDEKNRITFTLGTRATLARQSIDGGVHGPSKSRGPCVLTFQGAWEVNEHHEVVYTFTMPQWPGTASSGTRRSRTSRETRIKQELVFKGTWDLSDKNCLTYLVGVDSDSAFRFRGTFEGSTQLQQSGTDSARTRSSRPIRSILAKKGEIRYQVGVEYKTSRGARKRQKQTITLFGKWKFSDDLALSFEIEYAEGRRSEMRVGIELNLRTTGHEPWATNLFPDTISLNLVSRTGDPLGLELVLTKDFYDGDVQLFARFLRSAEETRGEFGVKILW
jgi:hypothetical protein